VSHAKYVAIAVLSIVDMVLCPPVYADKAAVYPLSISLRNGLSLRIVNCLLNASFSQGVVDKALRNLYNVHKMDRYKTIRVKEETWKQLVNLKRGLESLDDVIRKLLQSYKGR